MFRNTLVLVIAVALLAAPTGAAALDYREPESKAASVDLRSPDARDAGRVAQSPTSAPEVTDTTGFDWGDAGIGAGTVLGLLLISLSVMFGVMHRRRTKEGVRWYGRSAS